MYKERVLTPKSKIWNDAPVFTITHFTNVKSDGILIKSANDNTLYSIYIYMYNEIYV